MDDEYRIIEDETDKKPVKKRDVRKVMIVTNIPFRRNKDGDRDELSKDIL